MCIYICFSPGPNIALAHSCQPPEFTCWDMLLFVCHTHINAYAHIKSL